MLDRPWPSEPLGSSRAVPAATAPGTGQRATRTFGTHGLPPLPSILRATQAVVGCRMLRLMAPKPEDRSPGTTAPRSDPPGPRSTVIGPPAGLPPLGAKFLLSREPELLGAARGTSLPLPKGVGSHPHLFLPCLVHGPASARTRVTSMSGWAQSTARRPSKRLSSLLVAAHSRGNRSRELAGATSRFRQAPLAR